MKADLNSIRAELSKLTDLDYLKKEINRLAKEIRNYDIDTLPLSPQAKSRLHQLEKRFDELRSRLNQLQKQMDTEVNKFMTIVKKTRADAERRLAKAGLTKKTSKKKAGPRKPRAKKATT